jgi:hypothetical protein
MRRPTTPHSAPWRACAAIALGKVDWSLGPVQTVNAALNYMASGEQAGSLAAYSVDLWAFPADMANAEAGCMDARRGKRHQG